MGRMYRRTPRVPHTWRTREDPFEVVWPELEQRLDRRPEMTAKALFTPGTISRPVRPGTAQNASTSCAVLAYGTGIRIIRTMSWVAVDRWTCIAGST